MDFKNRLNDIVFFFLAGFFINTFAQEICSPPTHKSFEENNTINELVLKIPILEGVTLEITSNPEDAFRINNDQLLAVKVLDYETLPDAVLPVGLTCSKQGMPSINKILLVVVENINDNPPVFAQSQYNLFVNELSKVDTSVGKIEASDLDGDRLYYRLESPGGEFELESVFNPEILVKKILDFDVTPQVSLKLFAQDTALSPKITPSHTATTTITVNIVDVNNRPPWFQPCVETTVGTAKVCINFGYSGLVNLNEQETGPLFLEPEPVRAIDGDINRNDPISYKFVGGNEDDIFNIDVTSGSITMTKPVKTAGPIILTVMAYENLNPDQFATTTVTLQVVKKSQHPPQFVKSTYDGFISADAAVGSLVLQSKTSNRPVQVEATDEDFSDKSKRKKLASLYKSVPLQGINPDARFEITENGDFHITQEGFILTKRTLSPGSIDMQMRVVDTTNSESSTAALTVEVTPELTTTDMPITTTSISTAIPPVTTDSSITSTIRASTIAPDTTSTHLTSTSGSYTEGDPQPSGGFKTEDVIALGVSLAVALVLCLVAIGLLVYKVRSYRKNWRKLSEASIFRSTLSGGSDGPKGGVQYTNESFQNGSRRESLSSKEAAELALPSTLSRRVKDPEKTQTDGKASTLQPRSSNEKTGDENNTSANESSSQDISVNTDNEKEVKPILTKERRTEEGYKAVWFKQDIDNDSEEVVVIPDSEEQDHEDDMDDLDVNDEDEEDEEEAKENFDFAHL